MESDTVGSGNPLASIQHPALANQRLHHSGMDTPRRCMDADHFRDYPYPVVYEYNSRGFRDREWPEGLKDSIWCLGDSFTVGIGSPIEHTWPYILAGKSGKNTINISMDGASNDWIARQAISILEEIRPGHMVIMWSYLHRRENQIETTDLDRRQHYDYTSYQEDLANLIENVNQVLASAGNTQLCMCTIPRAFVDPLSAVFDLWQTIADASWPDIPLTDQQIENLPRYIREEMQTQLDCWDHYNDLREYHNRFIETVPDTADLLSFPKLIFETKQIDRARDGHHFDIGTSQSVVDRAVQVLGLV